MTIEVLAGALGIIASVVTTTMVIVSKLTRLEVMLAELRATMANFEHRISELERQQRERP
jgi:phage shock protein A